MKTFYSLLAVIIVGGAIWYATSHTDTSQMSNPQSTASSTDVSNIHITPIMHATAVLTWDDAVIYTDPTGGKEAFTNQPPASIVLITDIHSDHLSTSTLEAISGSSTLIVPQAVKDLLPQNLAARATVVKNGETITAQGFTITGIPMYNLPESPTAPHTKGRGNGYLVEKNGERVYVAGDTSGIPEMRNLTDIDIAFVPMNLPFTMTVEEAADAVLAFKPRKVYPYHYRGQNGLSDINEFKRLVNQADPNIDVVLLNWYPNQ